MICTQWDIKPPLAPNSIVIKAGEVFDLVLAFGPTDELSRPEFFTALKSIFPGTMLAGCSTCGEISLDGALEDHLIVTGIRFDQTRLRHATAAIGAGQDSDAGRSLAENLTAPDLRLVLLLSEGLKVHAQGLVDGLLSLLSPEVTISGGLAGDGDRFQKTVILTPEGLSSSQAIAIGFYGKSLQVRVASATGWEPFGRTRRVTRSKGSVIYELDGKPALGVYAGYLGEEAVSLPASGLVYPVSVQTTSGNTGLIRSLSGVNHEEGSLTFFGDIPEGSSIRLMNASYRELITGASKAASQAIKEFDNPSCLSLGLLFSCAGRKAVMKSHTALEIAAVSQFLPDTICLTGFHTYGEIGYSDATGRCEHHNQTMTVTFLTE